jgi:GT2 family glycosyltransferase
MNATPRPKFSIQIERFNQDAAASPQSVVAIPVKDEAERIGACLESLANQTVDLAEVAVVLLLNNCTDATAEIVRALAPSLPFALEMRRVELPEPYANAGWARRLAMDAAAELVRPDGLILTTDADTLVDTDWIEANRREIAAGVDGVAGYVMANPMELMELDPAILERGALEWEYQQLAAELEARADPEAHDPWPRHNQNCGASAAVSASAYRKIGGLPPKRVGEDRALFAMLRQADFKVRHSLDVHVVTSARTDGRALGGLSDAIRLRGDPGTPCDDALEVAVVTLRRALWRSALRRDWKAGRLDVAWEAWAARMRIAPTEFRRAVDRCTFGEMWADLETRSPRLERRLVTGGELRRELRRMRRLVEGARHQARDEEAWAARDRKLAVG